MEIWAVKPFVLAPGLHPVMGMLRPSISFLSLTNLWSWMSSSNTLGLDFCMKKLYMINCIFLTAVVMRIKVTQAKHLVYCWENRNIPQTLTRIAIKVTHPEVKWLKSIVSPPWIPFGKGRVLKKKKKSMRNACNKKRKYMFKNKN